MTYKSLFTGGKHEGKSVQQVLDMHDTPYLRWCYFNISAITFVDEILDLIFIYENLKIEKPGVKKGAEQEIYKKLMGARGGKMENGFVAMAAQIKSRVNKKQRNILISLERKHNNKGSLQRKNGNYIPIRPK